MQHRMNMPAPRALYLGRAEAEDVAEALEHVRELTAKRQRLMLEPEGEELASAACTVGCSRCFRACAVTGVILGWWEEELARSTCASAMVH